MYKAQWINRFFQFGTTNIDLLLEDDEEELPSQRFSMSFPGKPDEEKLSEVAEQRIALVMDEIENPPPVPPDPVKVLEQENQELSQKLDNVVVNLSFLNAMNQNIFGKNLTE